MCAGRDLVKNRWNANDMQDDKLSVLSRQSCNIKSLQLIEQRYILLGLDQNLTVSEGEG